ncbi:MAG TPA: DUF2283 domain-containing protein, partial [Thermoanaerobaculia bacterium]|nr:DUF2283 domain-containing protein [Thermoanaerobaculia bacterium]
MKYFYDYQTDSVSFDLVDVFEWAGSEELAQGVTVHLDRRRRPVAVEIGRASKVLDTLGLLPFREYNITPEEISLRMSSTECGQLLWRTIMRRMLVPDFPQRERTVLHHSV